MAGRQGGVHVSYLIVAMVICLGLVVALVTTNSKVQEATEAAAQAKKNRDSIEQENGDLRVEIEELRTLLTGNADDKPDIVGLQGELDSAADAVAKALDRQKKNYRGYTQFANEVAAVIEQQRTSLAKAQSESESQVASFAQQTETVRKLKSDHTSERDKLQEQIATAEQQFEDLNRRYVEDTERLRDELEEAADTASNQISDLNTQLLVQENLVAQKEERIKVLVSQIQNEREFSKTQPDGQVIEVAESGGKAWIDVGRNQRLRRGTLFELFQYVKGGRKQKKGRAEVIAVEDNYAEIRITNLIDDLNPIAVGDQIASPFYDPEATPTFVIAGDELSTDLVSLDEVSRRIASFGGKLQDAVAVDTSFVVVVDGYEQSEQFEAAKQFNIVILREDELLEFIGL